MNGGLALSNLNGKPARYAVGPGAVKVLAVGLSIFFAGCAMLGSYNPATGRKEFIFISTDMEVTMGQNIHQGLAKEFKFSQDQAKISRLERIGRKLATVSDRQDYEYRFFLIEKDEMNAFTVPGGSIYFFSGLFDKLKTDDQIAGVLAHEIGHCAAKHTVKKFQASMGYNLIEAIAFSRLGNTSGALSRQASAVAMNVVFSSYSRSDEYQADILGVKYMYLAGYDLNAMIQTFETLQKASQGDRGVPLIIRSHPYLDDRIAAVLKEIPQAPAKYGKKE